MTKVKKLLAAMLAAGLGLVPVGAAYADAGFDSSSWQGCINADTAKAAGAKFGIVKATEGNGYTDKYADCSIQSLKRAGLRQAVYHFARPDLGNSPEAEANWFLSQTKGYVGTGVLPVLDWEPGGRWNTQTWWAKRWLDRVQQVWGVKPLIYMSASVVNSADWSLVVKGDYGLWMAGYPRGYSADILRNPGNPPYSTGAWKNVTMWQYSSTGNVPGVGAKVDVNWFYGDDTTWQKYLGKSGGQSTGQSSKPQTQQPQQQQPAKPQVQTQSSLCVTVRYGDTISGIAARYGRFPYSAWRVPSGNINVIYPGQVACYGGGQPASGYSNSYTVRAGDTLSSIAARYGISYTSIHGYRSGNPNVIYPGEVLHW